MEQEILQQILTEISGIKSEIGGVKSEIGGIKKEISDLRDSQAAFEERTDKKLKSLMESQEIIMEIAKDSQKLLHKMERTLEQYDSDKVAVDIELTDLNRRVTKLEKEAG